MRAGPSVHLWILLASSQGAASQTRLLHYQSRPFTDSLGLAVAPAGDLDQDGFGDLVLGAAFNLLLGRGLGMVQVCSGRDGSTLLRLGGQGGAFGGSACGVGDLDGDGIVDIAVGAWAWGGGTIEAGAVFAHSGRNGALLWSVVGSPGNRLGMCVRSAGDVDGDGRPDVVASVPGVGQAVVLSGRNGARLRSLPGCHAMFMGQGSVDGVGDLDGDARPDLVVGDALRRTTQVYSGATGALLLNVPLPGFAVSRAGDVDFDGRGDFVIGDPTPPGGAWLLSGATGMVIHAFNGTTTTDNFGWCVAGGEDLDLDACPDVVVGAPQRLTGAVSTGYLMAFSGRTGALLATIQGAAPGDTFGVAVAVVPNLTRRGFGEIAVGAPQELTGRPDGGYVEAWSLAEPAGVGAGCSGAPLAPALQATPPRLGRVMTLTGLDHGANRQGVVFLSGTPALPTPLANGCTAYLEVGRSLFLASFASSTSGAWTVGLTVPLDFALLQQRMSLQSVSGPAPGPLGMALSNGVYSTVRP